VDYDGYSSTFELGDSGHRVYVTGVFGFGDGGVIFKAQNQKLGSKERLEMTIE
jgi:hypothetical protein